ncbi:hypothetical protein [Nocardia sp. alder85J]|uniref:hypothetical protein n=1 Tax=Nocardia sp. alder85J TaxID=2862949 RepID=UPI001CD4F675|nr:hypothetical protein [Nocardia sp. alder85J]MCX4093062.1 hypothetical protein [Nocardia sp. alder85J]
MSDNESDGEALLIADGSPDIPFSMTAAMPGAAPAPAVAADVAPGTETTSVPAEARSGAAASAPEPMPRSGPLASEPTPIAAVQPVPGTAPIPATASAVEDSYDPTTDIREYVTGLVADITGALLPDAPPRWEQLTMTCALTISAMTGDAMFLDAEGEPTRAEISDAAADLVRLLRTVTVPLTGRPWWRVRLRRDRSGATGHEFDYGDQPFPPTQLLTPDDYRADLEAFPLDRLPVWLAAHLDDRRPQLRTPAQSVVRARIDREAGTVATPFRFLDPETLWARWTTVAATAVAVGSDWGPRILGATAIFEATTGSGATLHRLPGNRAVLSGGVWNAPDLDAAYNDGAPMPDYFAGAPEWVSAPVLNPRVITGQLSFCYWWDGAGWHCGQSPSPARIGAAVPALWTAETVTEVVCGVLGPGAAGAAVRDLVLAAESATVTRDIVAAAFDLDGDTDLVGAFAQFALAGLVSPAS